MERVRFTQHKGIRLILIDMSDLKPDGILEVIGEAKKVIRSQPENSALLLTLVVNTHFNREANQALKIYAQHNNPYVRASAVVGAKGLQEIIVNGIKDSTGRHIGVFDQAEKAMDWLINYA